VPGAYIVIIHRRCLRAALVLRSNHRLSLHMYIATREMVCVCVFVLSFSSPSPSCSSNPLRIKCVSSAWPPAESSRFRLNYAQRRYNKYSIGFTSYYNIYTVPRCCYAIVEEIESGAMDVYNEILNFSNPFRTRTFPGRGQGSCISKKKKN